MTWFIHDHLKEMVPIDEKAVKEPHLMAIYEEVERLNKQRCAYCSGFGHSPKDCPTDFKLSHLMGGIAAQSRIMAKARREVKRRFK